MISLTYMSEAGHDADPRELEEAQLPSPHPRWGRELRRLWAMLRGVDENDLTQTELARLSGQSIATVNRLLGNAEGRPTLKAAIALFTAARSQGLRNAVPPWTPIVDASDYEWIDLGRHLRQRRPELFTAFLEILKEFGGAARRSHDEESNSFPSVVQPTDSNGRKVILGNGDEDENG